MYALTHSDPIYLINAQVFNVTAAVVDKSNL